MGQTPARLGRQSGQHESRAHRPWVPLALVALAAACVYLPLLGSGGLFNTEAFRAVPGFAIASGESGVWMTELFTTPYLRKPPGISWLIAASASLLGPTELAARLPSALSAIAAALIAAWTAGRVFGPRATLWAGLSLALSPWLWESGRRAEIEAPLLLATVMTVCGLVLTTSHAGTSHETQPPRTPTRLAPALLAGLGLALGFVLKGPAALPTIAGLVLALTLVGPPGARTLPGTRGRFLAAVGIMTAAAVVLTTLWAWPVWLRLNELETAGVFVERQSPTDFAFGPGWLAGAALLPIAAFAACLPGSLALLFVPGPDARAEATTKTDAHRLALAHALALGFVFAIGFTLLAGLSNHRYAQPALALCPLVVGWVASIWRPADTATGMTPTRARIAGALTLTITARRRPVRLLLPLLLIAAGVYVWRVEIPAKATSGREAGLLFADAAMLVLHPPATDPEQGNKPVTILARRAVDARPEVIWYARRALAARGVRSHAVWLRQDEDLTAAWARHAQTQTAPRTDTHAGQQTPPPVLFIARIDGRTDEAAGLPGKPRVLAVSAVHEYELALLTPETR